MKELKSNTLVGFLAGIVAAMLLFHIGTGSFSNRINAAPQARAAVPALTVTIAPTVSPATAPERTQKPSNSVEAKTLNRPRSSTRSDASKSLSSSESTIELGAQRPPGEPAQASPSGILIPAGGSSVLPAKAAVTRKPSKVRRIFGAVGKIALASVIPGQAVMGNTVQAINQSAFPSTQATAAVAPSTQTLPVPMSTANTPPQGLSSAATSASIVSAPVVTTASTGKRGKVRRFFGALGRTVQVEVGSGKASAANQSVQPAVTPILPSDAGCTSKKDQCKADLEQPNSAPVR